jgi:hypothetical protein
MAEVVVELWVSISSGVFSIPQTAPAGTQQTFDVRDPLSAIDRHLASFLVSN